MGIRICSEKKNRTCLGDQSRRRKTINLKQLTSLNKLTLCQKSWVNTYYYCLSSVKEASRNVNWCIFSAERNTSAFMLDSIFVTLHFSKLHFFFYLSTKYSYLTQILSIRLYDIKCFDQIQIISIRLHDIKYFDLIKIILIYFYISFTGHWHNG